MAVLFIIILNFIVVGFTRCPDICPEEIEKMIKAIDLVQKVDIKGSKILSLFITVDPERDDIEVKNFNLN